MANQVFHFSNIGISSGQRFYLKDDVSGIFVNNLNINSDFPIIASNLVYNTGDQTISGVKTFADNLEVQGTGIFNSVDLSNISEFQFSGTNINIRDGDVNLSGNATISGNLTVTGNLNSAGNYYVKVARLADQTIAQGADAVIQFSGVADPNNWYNSGTYRTTPTVAGNYAINVAAVWRPGTIPPTNQVNIQIRKGVTTIALVQEPVHSGMNITQNAFAIASLNGSSDYIDVTAYTSNTTSQNLIGTADGAWTKMELFKLN